MQIPAPILQNTWTPTDFKECRLRFTICKNTLISALEILSLLNLIPLPNNYRAITWDKSTFLCTIFTYFDNHVQLQISLTANLKKNKTCKDFFSFFNYSDTVLKCLLQGTKEFTWALIQNILKVNSLLPVDFSMPPIRLPVPENWPGYLWERNCTLIHGNAWNPRFFCSCWSSQGLRLFEMPSAIATGSCLYKQMTYKVHT